MIPIWTSIKDRATSERTEKRDKKKLSEKDV